jgi:hypothetical protein
VGYRDDEVALESRVEVIELENRALRGELEELVRTERSLRRRITRRRALNALKGIPAWAWRHKILSAILLFFLGLCVYLWGKSAAEEAARKQWLEEESVRGCQGILKVEASYDDAEVRVNDQYAGRVPVKVRICPGAHRVRVIHWRALPWQREVTMPKAGTVTLGANLIPWNPAHRPKGGTLLVTDPSDALLFIDGVEVGWTPAFLEDQTLGSKKELLVGLYARGNLPFAKKIRRSALLGFDLARDPKDARPVEKGP